MSGRVALTYERRILAGTSRGSAKTCAYARRTTRGASLSMALLFILVAAVVGFIIVTAATVLAGRATSAAGATREQVDQQQYFLRSAARLVESELVGENGVQVCLGEKQEGTGDARWFVGTTTLGSGATYAWTDPTTQAPANVLEYLVWQKEHEPNPNPEATRGANQWLVYSVGTREVEDEANPGAKTTETINNYYLEVILEFSSTSSTAKQWLGDFPLSEGGKVSVLCKLTADDDLNITAVIGYLGDKKATSSITKPDNGSTFAGNKDATGTEGTITLNFPSLRVDLPEEATATDPATDVTTTTGRYLYVWGVN